MVPGPGLGSLGLWQEYGVSEQVRVEGELPGATSHPCEQGRKETAEDSGEKALVGGECEAQGEGEGEDPLPVWDRG